MKTPVNISAKVLANRWTWAAVGALLVAFLLWKNAAKIRRLFRRDVTDYTADAALSPSDKVALKALAQALFAELDGFTFNTDQLQNVLLLNNTELNYLANVYPDYSQGESLRDAIDGEWITGDADAQLIARLNAMNL